MKKLPSFLSVILCYFCLFSFQFSSSINVLAQQSNERRLRYVQAIWRHGDRAPKKKPYEADIYDEKYWPRGWNQLTTLGMQQMQELGRFFRNRYVGTFLSAEFRRKEVFIRSTAVDRAIESAQAMLSGMFPPTPNEQFDATLNWQPIPIHSAIDGQSDPLLRPSSFACPHYQKLKREVKEALEEELMPKYKDFAANLRPILNISEDRPIKFRAITELKSIQMEVFHNLTQPDWVHKRWPKYGNKSTLELIVELRDKERVAEFNGSQELARLSGGYLLGDWLKRAKKVANTTSAGDEQKNGTAQKMLLYSAHDGTLLALLSAFGVKNMPLKMPSFSACILMEIYQTKMGQFFVELYYRQNGQQLEPLIVGNCTSKSCPLDIFVESTKENAIFEVDSLFDKCDAQKCVMMKSGGESMRNFNNLIIFSIFLFSFFHKFIVL